MLWETMDNEDGLPSYLNRLTQAPLLTPEEEVRLTREAQQGCADSRERLAESNMRLVINIAKTYRNKSFPMEDLVQEGAIGLMHAIDRFNPDKGFRFSTYATHWIRQSIGRAVDNKAKAIRLPAHISQALRKIERAKAKLSREQGHEGTLEEIAEELGINVQRLLSVMQSGQEMISLDMNVGEHENTTLAHLLKDEHVSDPELEVLQREFLDELREALSELTEREQIVLKYRLKLGGEENSAELREELVTRMQLSRERIRQIEVQALRRLRVVAQRRQLRELLIP